MDVIDDTAQFIQQIGLFDENMRILISISIAICIVFVVIALLTIKFYNGIFIKVRNSHHHGQDTLQTNSNQLHPNNWDQNPNPNVNVNPNANQNPNLNSNPNSNSNPNQRNHCVDGVDENATCQSVSVAQSRTHSNPQNILTMPNNDCTISAVNSLSERIPLQNYQHFHHHYHHHHHFHLPPPLPSHGNSHNHFVFNSNVFNANTVHSSNASDSLGLKHQKQQQSDNDNGHFDSGNNLIVKNLSKGDTSNNDDYDDNTGRVSSTRGGTINNEQFSMARIGSTNPSNLIARGHLQGHLHSHYPRYSQQIV